MGLAKWLIDKERRFAWSLLGTVIGIVSLYLAYIALRDKQAELAFNITSEANVLDVHRPLPSLEIRFQGEDIQQQALNLRVLTVQVANTGEVPFAVQNGHVIEVRPVRGNDSYLQSALNPTLRGDSVFLAKPIFERNSFVVLEVLVLHARQIPPTIVTFGKIAGIKQFKVSDVGESASTEPFWRRAIDGSVAVQVARLGIYTVGLFVLMGTAALVVAAIFSASDQRTKRRRRKEVQAYLGVAASDRDVRSFFADVYIDEGRPGILAARSMMTDPKLLRREMIRARSLTRRQGNALGQAIQFDGPVITDRQVYMNNPFARVALRLYQSQVVRVNDDKSVSVADGALRTLDELLAYVGEGREASQPHAVVAYETRRSPDA